MTFSLSLGKAIENIKEDRDKIVRGTIIGISSRIIKRTPVGNPSLWKSPPPPGYVGGSLRGGWQASIGAPDMVRTGKIDKTGAPTIANAVTVASAVEVGQTFYLTNSQPHARPVEYGWSSQAPQGMVRRSIVEANQILNQQASK